MDQERKDPGKQEPVTPAGAHGEQFYAILRTLWDRWGRVVTVAYISL